MRNMMAPCAANYQLLLPITLRILWTLLAAFLLALAPARPRHPPPPIFYSY
jgi:hypothetical protein